MDDTARLVLLINVTRIIPKLESLDLSLAVELFPFVHDGISKLLASQLHCETKRRTSMQAELIHGTLLRVVDADGVQLRGNRGRFFGIATESSDEF